MFYGPLPIIHKKTDHPEMACFILMPLKLFAEFDHNPAVFQ